MARGKKLKVTFKLCDQNQTSLLPLNLEDLIDSAHPVRVVNSILDRIDITKLIRLYRPGGASSYHPRMLLKVLVYAYINNIYSSRKIEAELSRNIHFMWLSAMNKPDHNTISRFRAKKLEDTLKPIFIEVVTLLNAEGLLSIKELYTDGTKIEANANRYTFVWGGSIKTSKERISKQLNELWSYAQNVAGQEMDDPEPPDFKKIDSETVIQTINNINEVLKDKPVEPKVRQKLNYAKKNWPSALDKYEQQEKTMGQNRSSYSKTDPDATFMRLKEDHMKNGQLKPAYNAQISTNNQFIVSYSVHQNTNDINTLIPHVEQLIKDHKFKPSNITADAGYGSEQNYEWLENKRITAYIKHNQFNRKQHKTTNEKDPYANSKMQYNEQKDEYSCAAGQKLKNVGSIKKKTRNGFEQSVNLYQTKKCCNCPLQNQCNPGKSKKTIEVNHNKNRLFLKAEKRLKTKKGIEKRKRRCYDTEPVFANIKHNHGFKRFMLRGLKKVNIELGLIALAHNLRKKCA